MNYYLYKLCFSSPVHFGSSDSAVGIYESSDHFKADTLFSALCNQAKILYGESEIDVLAKYVQDDKLLLSDSMIWSGDNYFIPKPCVVPQNTSKELTSRERKSMKKLSWIPVCELDKFCDSLKGGSLYDSEHCINNFGINTETTKARIQEENDAVPYQLGIFTFFDSCGLYFIAGCSDDTVAQKLSTLTAGLGEDGLGGKTSSGYGKFTVKEIIQLRSNSGSLNEELYKRLIGAEYNSNILLTTSVPNDDEIEDVLSEASFQLSRRSGFVQSETFSDTPVKKITEYYLSAGAVLKKRFSGSLREVGIHGNHPVYRYSKPLFLGVDL